MYATFVTTNDLPVPPPPESSPLKCSLNAAARAAAVEAAAVEAAAVEAAAVEAAAVEAAAAAGVFVGLKESELY